MFFFSFYIWPVVLGSFWDLSIIVSWNFMGVCCALVNCTWRLEGPLSLEAHVQNVQILILIISSRLSLSLCVLLFPLYETPIRWPFPFEPLLSISLSLISWTDQCPHVKSPPGSCLGSVSPSVRVLKAEVERGWVKLGVGKRGWEWPLKWKLPIFFQDNSNA